MIPLLLLLLACPNAHERCVRSHTVDCSTVINGIWYPATCDVCDIAVYDGPPTGVRTPPIGPDPYAPCTDANPCTCEER